MERKQLKETKLGSWLANKAPDLFSTLGDVVPGGEALKVVGRLVDNLTESEEERQEVRRMIYELEQQDRDSARRREVGFVQALGKRDWMQAVTGLVGLGALLMMIYWAIRGVDEREIFFHLLGAIEGVAITIYGYYFGSSAPADSK